MLVGSPLAPHTVRAPAPKRPVSQAVFQHFSPRSGIWDEHLLNSANLFFALWVSFTLLLLLLIIV